jgi:hypothetical protein
MPRPPEIEQSEVLSIRVPASVVRTIDAHAEGSSRSAAAAVFLQFGIEELTRPGAREALEAHHLLTQAQQLMARCSMGRCTSTGRWFPELPSAEQVGQMMLPEVITTPEQVLVVDQQGQVLAFTVSGATIALGGSTAKGHQHAVELELGDLVALTGQLGAAIVDLSNKGVDRAAAVHGGLKLARLESGELALAFGALAMVIPARLVWVLLAELNGAIARQLAGSLAAREALEQQLQASPMEVQA